MGLRWRWPPGLSGQAGHPARPSPPAAGRIRADRSGATWRPRRSRHRSARTVSPSSMTFPDDGADRPPPMVGAGGQLVRPADPAQPVPTGRTDHAGRSVVCRPMDSPLTALLDVPVERAEWDEWDGRGGWHGWFVTTERALALVVFFVFVLAMGVPARLPGLRPSGEAGGRGWSWEQDAGRI